MKRLNTAVVSLLTIATLQSCNGDRFGPGILLYNNSDNVIFVNSGNYSKESESQPKFPYRTENSFFEYAKKIEPKESRLIKISDYYDRQTFIIIEDPTIRRHEWDEITENKLYKIMQFSLQNAAKSDYMVIYTGWQTDNDVTTSTYPK